MPGSPDATPDLALDVLQGCRLFSGLDDASLGLLSGALRSRRFRRGETIFHAGDPGDALFIVTSGWVKIVVPSEDGAEAAILTTIGPGGYFGELALLDGAPRSATAVGHGPVTTAVLHREAFERLLDDQPAMRRTLLATLAAEIRRLTAQVEDLHFLDLPGRLARHLLRSLPGVTADAVAHGVGLPDGETRLAWPFTQGELAGMIGGSRQSVNRLLADFVADGLLRFEGDELIIPDARRLARAAGR